MVEPIVRCVEPPPGFAEAFHQLVAEMPQREAAHVGFGVIHGDDQLANHRPRGEQTNVAHFVMGATLDFTEAVADFIGIVVFMVVPFRYQPAPAIQETEPARRSVQLMSTMQRKLVAAT